MRYLGIDYGEKKIGLALSDEGGTMGFPHAVVPTPSAQAALTELFARERVDAVVVGESKGFDGSDNAIAPAARAFAAWIATQFKVPLFWEPEVLTTAEARRMPEKQEKSRAPKSRAPVDASAAALILTSYLSRHHG